MNAGNPFARESWSPPLSEVDRSPIMSDRDRAKALAALAARAIENGFPIRRIGLAEAVEYDIAGNGVDAVKSAIQKARASRRGTKRAEMVERAKAKTAKKKGAA